MAQMSFGLRGGFCPTSLPLFQGSRVCAASMSDSFVVDRSLIVESNAGNFSNDRFTGADINEYYRP